MKIEFDKAVPKHFVCTERELPNGVYYGEIRGYTSMALGDTPKSALFAKQGDAVVIFAPAGYESGIYVGSVGQADRVNCQRVKIDTVKITI